MHYSSLLLHITPGIPRRKKKTNPEINDLVSRVGRQKDALLSFNVTNVNIKAEKVTLSFKTSSQICTLSKKVY